MWYWSDEIKMHISGGLICIITNVSCRVLTKSVINMKEKTKYDGCIKVNYSEAQ